MGKVKKCCRCERWFTIQGFNKNSKKSDGLSPYCRLCAGILNNKYYNIGRECIRVLVVCPICDKLFYRKLANVNMKGSKFNISYGCTRSHSDRAKALGLEPVIPEKRASKLPERAYIGDEYGEPSLTDWRPNE